MLPIFHKRWSVLLLGIGLFAFVAIAASQSGSNPPAKQTGEHVKHDRHKRTDAELKAHPAGPLYNYAEEIQEAKGSCQSGPYTEIVEAKSECGAACDTIKNVICYPG